MLEATKLPSKCKWHCLPCEREQPANGRLFRWKRTDKTFIAHPPTRKQPAENQKSQNLRSSSLPCGHWHRSQAIFVGTGPWCRGPWMSGSSWSASRPPHGQLGCCRGLPALWTVPPGRSAGERGGLSTHACLPARTHTCLHLPTNKRKKKTQPKNLKHPAKWDHDSLKLLLHQANSKPPPPCTDGGSIPRLWALSS